MNQHEKSVKIYQLSILTTNLLGKSNLNVFESFLVVIISVWMKSSTQKIQRKLVHFIAKVRKWKSINCNEYK